MKLAKMSLAAAMLLGVNVYAIDNVKVNGDVKVYYGTVDSDKKGESDMFNKDASFADAALHLGLTADLSEGVSAGISVTAVSTLGLENNLVSNTYSGAHPVTSTTKGASFVDGGDLQVDDAMWVDEAWIAGTAFDTTAKLGRQALDTPLAFTETWGIDTNTFEAAVLLNQSLPDTTLVAAWIGKSNGSSDDTGTGGHSTASVDRAAAGYVAKDGRFNTFAKDGAYAVAVVNNSWKPLTAQAWYYSLQGLADAYWLQADLNMEGILAGVQYANVDHEATGLDRYVGEDVGTVATTGDNDTTAYSVMLGYEMKDVVTIKAAYSSVDDDGTLGVANTATGRLATVGGQSKLYTEMWWNYGNVSLPGADSFSLVAEGKILEADVSLGYYFCEIDIDETKAGLAALGHVKDVEVSEITLAINKSFGPLDTGLALTYTDADKQDYTANTTVIPITPVDDEKSTMLQVYLGYNF